MIASMTRDLRVLDVLRLGPKRTYPVSPPDNLRRSFFLIIPLQVHRKKKGSWMVNQSDERT